MSKKRTAKVDKDGYVTFLNDEDGLSSKDYLLVISTIIFFGFVIVGLCMVLFGIPLSDQYIELLGMVDAPLMTIIAGIMSVQAVEYVTDRKKSSNDSKVKEMEDEDIV